jgi:alpha-beta hydrolase superfamily lysophospholipase
MNYIAGFAIFLSILLNGNFPWTRIEKRSFTSGGINYDVYSPAKDAAKVLLLAHGMNKTGKDETEIVHFAETLARAGVIVFVPENKGLADFRIGRQEVNDMRMAIDKMTELFPGKRKGVMTFCYANGVVAAALDGGRREKLDYIVLWGSYADYKDVMMFNLTGYYIVGNNRFYAEPDSSVIGHYIDFLVPEEKKDVRTAMKNGSAAGLSREDTAIYNFFTNRDYRKYDYYYARLPDSYHAWVNEMSVENRIKDIKCNVLFIHSKHDTIIPYYETLKLYDLCGSKHKELFLPDLFEHFDPLNLKGISENELFNVKGFITYYRFIVSLLDI